jgi:hypothetical protein
MRAADEVSANRSVAKPPKPTHGCTCNCRADADDNMPGNLKPELPLFAFATVTAADCIIAARKGKREATHQLRMKPKHVKMPVHRVNTERMVMSDLQPGDRVILTKAPASLLRGLPKDDQRAIRSIVGRSVVFAGFSYGQAELEFKDAQGDDHTVWVEPSLIKAA